MQHPPHAPYATTLNVLNYTFTNRLEKNYQNVALRVRRIKTRC